MAFSFIQINRLDLTGLIDLTNIIEKDSIHLQTYLCPIHIRYCDISMKKILQYTDNFELQVSMTSQGKHLKTYID